MRSSVLSETVLAIEPVFYVFVEFHEIVIENILEIVPRTVAIFRIKQRREEDFPFAMGDA